MPIMWILIVSNACLMEWVFAQIANLNIEFIDIKDNKKCKPCMTNCYKCYNMTNCI